ncbi:hypothetical protein ES711_03765 [Gelidibacter salicanalis]|uniref:Uncharacterized protein n=1 Tax=Gelidibacter salicanalis TaxID=291193 RepID=A0A5C7AT90_9FLAO|nr:hypothetical protein [Gelidibacter salicanalis]TXE09062.1 hypothetical protein ES711_03765 [Gelidibacter salicanalis]
MLFSCKGNGQSTEIGLKNNAIEADSNVPFSGDYNDLLTLELASQITSFDPEQAQKMHTMKGMLGEMLRYYWENGRERHREASTPNRKNTKMTATDLVQIKWVDDEADMESFLNFIDLKAHPELVEVNGVGDNAYWNSKKQLLEVYYHGVSFTLQVDMSNDEAVNKEKTIALAKLMISEKL